MPLFVFEVFGNGVASPVLGNVGTRVVNTKPCMRALSPVQFMFLCPQTRDLCGNARHDFDDCISMTSKCGTSLGGLLLPQDELDSRAPIQHFRHLRRVRRDGLRTK